MATENLNTQSLESFDSRFNRILSELDECDNLRQLRTSHTLPKGNRIIIENKEYINLASNDYLGIACRKDLELEFMREVMSELESQPFLLSNPSSRLITGNSDHYDRLESTIANLLGCEASLVLGSGYLLGVGIFQALANSKDDVIIADKLVHSSLIDGIKLSPAIVERFRHNDANHLQKLLAKYDGRRIIVVTESLFSMDGDKAPLAEIAELQKRYEFMLYLDEAHAFGAMGESGKGLSSTVPDLRVDLFAATMGKAIASQGAFVACSNKVREMLINRMRSLIFSTALPPISLMWSQNIIGNLNDFEPQRVHLAELTSIMESESYIVPIMAHTNKRALEISDIFKQNGFWATAIRHPTVPMGQSRVRVSLSAASDTSDIQRFKELCNTIG